MEKAFTPVAHIGFSTYMDFLNSIHGEGRLCRFHIDPIDGGVHISRYKENEKHSPLCDVNRYVFLDNPSLDCYIATHENLHGKVKDISSKFNEFMGLETNPNNKAEAYQPEA